MPRKPEDFQLCVYVAGFTNTHKLYIGSTVRWPYRSREHWADLEAGKHANQYWQRAFNKYGKDHMCLRELEFCKDETSLRAAEQKWIDFYKSADSRFGFNLVKEVQPSGTSGYKWTDEQRKQLSNSHIAVQLAKHSGSKAENCALYDPAGNLVQIENLYTFCREKGLPYKEMDGVRNDLRVECQGWKLDPTRKHRKKASFSFISPQGEKVSGHGLRDFCRSNGLCYRNMLELYRGIVKKTEGGWRRVDLTEEQCNTYRGKDWTLISPDGERVYVNNLRAFCRKMSLNCESLRKKCTTSGWKIAV